MIHTFKTRFCGGKLERSDHVGDTSLLRAR